MKFRTLVLFSICISFLISCSNENIIKLPIIEKNGYGPFESSLGGISPYSDSEDDPWKKTHLKVSGVPKNWTDIKIGDINTDFYQSVYQNYFLDNITNERYEELQKSWNWTPDSLNLSKKPIKCKIAFAFGKDSIGELKMIVDSNNNLDFSDDKIFKPLEISPNDKLNNDSLVISDGIEVTFERFSNNKVTKVNVPILIVHVSEYNIFLCNFSQYATTKLDEEEIAISSANFLNLSYHSLGIVKIDKDIDKDQKVDYKTIIAKNEYIEIKNNIYKNLGVNKNQNVLILEKINLPKNQLSSTQVGFKAFDFSGDNFKTKTAISLDNLKGKYVLLDFWATWCGPCIKEIPNLTDFYSKIDKSKFEIISIVCESPLETLEKMTEKHAISWPQIVSDDTNKIKEKYGILGYPTTFLLSPEGVIIAKNLRGEKLVNKVISLINE